MRVAVAGCILWCAQAAWAADALQFIWEAPPGCPDTRDVLERVDDLTNQSLALTTPLVFEGRIEAQPAGGFLLQMKSSHRGLTQQRQLEAKRCDELGQAAALMLSLALHNSSEPVPVILASPPARVIPKLSSLWVGGSGLVDLGPLPAPAPRVQIEIAYFTAPLRLALDVSFGFPQTILGVPREDAGAVVHALLSAGLRVCLVPFLQRFEFDVCLGGEGATFTASGIGLAQPTTGLGLWVGALSALAAGYAITPRLALRTELAAGVALSRPLVTVEEAGSIFQSSPFFLRASLGFSIRLF